MHIGRTPHIHFGAIMALCLLLAMPQANAVDNPNPELTLHIELVELALETDAYNKRCRGMSIAKALNQVNRLYVTKYSLTAHNFIKEYIDKDVRGVKSDRQHRFNEKLHDLGGCHGTNTRDALKALRKQFQTSYEQAEKSAWYPE